MGSVAANSWAPRPVTARPAAGEEIRTATEPAGRRSGGDPAIRFRRTEGLPEDSESAHAIACREPRSSRPLPMGSRR